MPITSIQSDPLTLSLTVVGDYPVPVERLWQAWTDPRQVERFWGPPQWPATFTRLDLRAGGRADYFMSGPNGERNHGYWVFDEVDAPRSFTARDGFAHPDGTPMAEFPEGKMRFRFESTATGSRFTMVSTNASLEDLEKLLAMGMLEGLKAALAQMDEVLADRRAHSRSFTTALEVVDDTHVVVRREVRGTLQQVWRAHHEPALVREWMLGPDGWTMPVCDVARAVGEAYRYEWENAADQSRFGFEGEVLEMEAPRRAVTTERMIGMPGEGTKNELVLSPRPGTRTLIEVRITYPSRELRDMVLGTGMVDGMEASYARMEGLALGAEL